MGALKINPQDGKLERPYLGAVKTTEDPGALSRIDLSHFIKLFPRMTENISHGQQPFQQVQCKIAKKNFSTVAPIIAKKTVLTAK